jgi:hypothetical protein
VDGQELGFLGVEAPSQQGVKSQEYLDNHRFYTDSRTGCAGVKNGKLFLSEPWAKHPGLP